MLVKHDLCNANCHLMIWAVISVEKNEIRLQRVAALVRGPNELLTEGAGHKTLLHDSRNMHIHPNEIDASTNVLIPDIIYTGAQSFSLTC